MAYVKNTWVDQNVSRPKTYEVTTNQDGTITLTDSFGVVTELGTPVNATNMNHIEDGLALSDVMKYSASVTYSTGEWVTGTVNNEKKIFESLADSNTGNALTDTTKWQEVQLGGSSRLIGEIVKSTMPLVDAGLHLLDGALLASGSYADFVDYIGGLYDSGDYTAIFDTEANWQAAVTLSGVCDKFVYDSVNNTVRLPKYGNQIFTKSPTIASTVPVKGNGVTLGLTDGTTNYGLQTTTSSIQTDNNLFSSNNYNTAVGSAYSSSGLPSNKSLGITTDGSKSGMVADLSSITNYPLNCYYYIVIATTTKTSIEVDIDEIATDLAGKMDKDGTNAVSSVKFADGQWVKSSVILAQLATAPTSTDIEHDLSTYLPNDSYSYEVLFLGTATTASTSGSQNALILTSQYFDGAYLCRAHTRSSSAITDSGSSILPIGSNHKVTVNAWTSNTGTYSLLALAYRRIGTNQ